MVCELAHRLLCATGPILNTRSAQEVYMRRAISRALSVVIVVARKHHEYWAVGHCRVCNYASVSPRARALLFVGAILCFVTTSASYGQTIIVPPPAPSLPPPVPPPYPIIERSKKSLKPPQPIPIDPRCRSLTDAQKRETPGCH